MKFTLTTTALCLLLSSAFAAPAPAKLEARQAPAGGIYFQGADPDASFTIESVPLDNTIFPITNPLSVTTITANVQAVCRFNGTEGPAAFTVGTFTTTVGPPQRLVSGACLRFSFPGQLCPGAIECFPHPPVEA